MRVYCFYQCVFLGSCPTFDYLFSLQCGISVVTMFEVDELIYVISLGKAVCQMISVFV